ncbi:MAG TPA: condensation domain-containing protein, partial [Pyrinomonadaceae bacterium]|nr:condensation domain-containing protein [Pyrinomonadaceae bacterium]
MKNIDDLYKLSPVQQDLLNDRLSAQAIYAIEGQLDHARFKTAWEQALARHVTLRTAFYWKGLEKPVQAVQQRPSLLFEVYDWRSANEQSQKLEALISDDRKLSFDLNRAPLMRLSLIQLASDVHRLIWTYHPLILDQASAALVIDNVFRLYRSERLNGTGSFKEYISWLRQQERTGSEQFWSELLRGCDSPSTLDGVAVSTFGPRNEQQAQLSDSLSTALQNFLNQHQITMTALLAGAWALLLCRYNDQDEAVFGVAFSGRPDSLPQINSIAGPFGNVLPARLRVPRHEQLATWLKKIEAWYESAKEHQHVGQQEIRNWSNLPETSFESLISVLPAVSTIRSPEPRVELLHQFTGMDHAL